MADYDLGIVGGGQLARMTAQAASRMGLSVLCLDPGADTPAGAVADALQGRLDDADALSALFAACERVTLENEFVPADALEEGIRIAEFDPENLVPGVHALRVIQDKLHQRDLYAKEGVASPRATALEEAVAEGAKKGSGVAKSRFGGYDGRGVRLNVDAAVVHAEVGDGTWLWEDLVPFTRELSVMVAIQGDTVATYPVMVTEQADAVCDVTYPYAGDPTTALDVAVRAAKALKSDGLYGVELFELSDGAVMVNEIAPRPHNSGHYTLDWGGTSQFEQHLRVAMGLPIDAQPVGRDVTMVNLLGIPDAGDWRDGLWTLMAEFPHDVHLHWYGKAESRPGRKMGHINVGGADPQRARDARAAFLRGWRGD